MNLNRDLSRLLGNMGTEKFTVTFVDQHGKEREFTDTIMGLLGYIIESDEIIGVTRVV